MSTWTFQYQIQLLRDLVAGGEKAEAAEAEFSTVSFFAPSA